MKIALRITITFIFVMMFAQNVFAAKFSNEMKQFIKNEFPNSTLRFDGLVTMPDGTLYLPLYPSLVKYPDKIEVKDVISANKNEKHPDIIILNNDYVFMKVIKNSSGQKSLLYLKNPPIEVKTGLLPQDMLVPSGLFIPDNIKGIIGNLEIPTVKDNGLKLDIKPTEKTKKNKQQNVSQSVVSVLKDKVFYISSSISKNIQVVASNHTQPDYALEQNGIVYDFKATPDNKFLLVTNFGKTYLEVISLADDMVIKQIDLTNEGGDILIDRDRNKAYISSPSASCLYVLDLSNMTLKQKIKLKGKCVKVVLTDKNRKIFYFDQNTKEVWSVELDNDYITKYIGSFPNVSKIEYANGKVYLTSRVAGRIAIVDYETLNLVSEMPVKEKPIDMLIYRNYLYILSASTNTIQVLDVMKDEIIQEINLNNTGFSSKIYRINDSNFAIVPNAASNTYSVIDLNKNIFVKNNVLEVPVTKMVILPVIRKN